jgi:P2-related tail formation protein
MSRVVSRVGETLKGLRPFEAAAAAGMSDTLPVPLRAAMDPAAAPAALLPWLAAHEGVRLWFEDWSEARKRQIIAAWPRIAPLIGTREAARRLLAFVDAELIDARGYPDRFVIGRSVIGRTSIGHPPYVARYLVRVRTFTPPRAVVIGRTPIGRGVLRTPSRRPFERALAALRIAKAPWQQVRVDFAHRRPATVADGFTVDDAIPVGHWVDRNRL